MEDAPGSLTALRHQRGKTQSLSVLFSALLLHSPRLSFFSHFYDALIASLSFSRSFSPTDQLNILSAGKRTNTPQGRGPSPVCFFIKCLRVRVGGPVPVCFGLQVYGWPMRSFLYCLWFCVSMFMCWGNVMRLFFFYHTTTALELVTLTLLSFSFSLCLACFFCSLSLSLPFSIYLSLSRSLPLAHSLYLSRSLPPSRLFTGSVYRSSFHPCASYVARSSVQSWMNDLEQAHRAVLPWQRSLVQPVTAGCNSTL